VSRNSISVHEIGGWMAEMRAAVFDGIRPGDIAAITAGIVAKARGGDLKAAEFLFRYVIGAPARPEPQVIDVTTRQPGDPSEDQIRGAAEQIKATRLARLRGEVA
jgi:hypothetical protein